MTSPEDSNLGQRWWTANPNIPTQRCGAVGFLRVNAEEDVNHGLCCVVKTTEIND
jgi:hypothetical protein